VDCAKAANEKDPECAASSVPFAVFDLTITACAVSLADNASTAYAAFATAIKSAVTSFVGVDYTVMTVAQSLEAITVACIAARRLSGARTAITGSGIVTIVVPVPLSLGTTTLPAVSLATSRSTVLAQVAARMTALFASPTATTAVFIALSSAVGFIVPPGPITIVVNPAFAAANPVAAVVVSTMTASIRSETFTTGVVSGTPAWVGIVAGGVIVAVIVSVCVGFRLLRRSAAVAPIGPSESQSPQPGDHPVVDTILGAGCT